MRGIEEKQKKRKQYNTILGGMKREKTKTESYSKDKDIYEKW